MTRFVLDASAMLRLFLEDGPMPEGLLEAIGQAESGESLFIVPELFWAETAQVLHRRRRVGQLDSKELKRMWQDVQGLPAQSVRHAPYITPALALAESHELSVYDALYLAIAYDLQIPLLSADKKLHNAAATLNLLP